MTTLRWFRHLRSDLNHLMRLDDLYGRSCLHYLSGMMTEPARPDGGPA